MSALAESAYTSEQYLALERQAHYKSEYVNGGIFAMVGASKEHHQIAFNLAGEMEYGLIAQDKIRVEHYFRQDKQWVLTEMSRLDDTLCLVSLQCEILLREIYAKVDL